MSLLKAGPRSGQGTHCRARRRSAVLGVLFVAAAAASACAQGEDASRRSPDTSGSPRAASGTAQTFAASDSQHVVLAVKGMYCASCEQTVVTMLRRTAGVLRADVNFDRGEAAVSYDSTLTSPEQLVQVVRSLGYHASVKRT